MQTVTCYGLRRALAPRPQLSLSAQNLGTEARTRMSGGKRNHEDLSDEMALLEAALKVYRGRTVAHSVPHKFRQRSRWRRARQRTKAPPVVHKPRAPRAQSCATRSRGVQMCVTEREMAGRNCNQCDSGREADGRRAKRRAKALRGWSTSRGRRERSRALRGAAVPNVCHRARDGRPRLQSRRRRDYTTVIEHAAATVP